MVFVDTVTDHVGCNDMEVFDKEDTNRGEKTLSAECPHNKFYSSVGISLFKTDRCLVELQVWCLLCQQALCFCGMPTGFKNSPSMSPSMSPNMALSFCGIPTGFKNSPSMSPSGKEVHLHAVIERRDDCLHEKFTTTVNIVHLSDVAFPHSRYLVELQCHCTSCRSPLRFEGLRLGLIPETPTMGPFGEEARLPCDFYPEIIRKASSIEA